MSGEQGLTSNVPYREAFMRGVEAGRRDVKRLREERDILKGGMIGLQLNNDELQARNEQLIEALVDIATESPHKESSNIAEQALSNQPLSIYLPFRKEGTQPKG